MSNHNKKNQTKKNQIKHQSNLRRIKKKQKKSNFPRGRPVNWSANCGSEYFPRGALSFYDESNKKKSNFGANCGSEYFPRGVLSLAGLLCQITIKKGNSNLVGLLCETIIKNCKFGWIAVWNHALLDCCVELHSEIKETGPEGPTRCRTYCAQ